MSVLRVLLCACVLPCAVSMVRAADHLDTPTVLADPAADIGDLYAWTDPDGRHLNLVMDIVGKRFSDAVDYVFHISSAPRFGVRTRRAVTLRCRFDVAGAIDCRAPGALRVRGQADGAAGLRSKRPGLRVYAGQRNDPFFNNVRGTRWAYNAAADALAAGVVSDAAGCPAFDAATVAEIQRRWRSTEDGAPTDFLRGWTTSALVLQIDLERVDGGGPLLAVWASTEHRGRRRAPPLDRMGRPLTANALLGPLEPAAVVNARKEAWNRAAPPQWPQFVAPVARTLALYDGFDGRCGNQWLAADPPAPTYLPLAALLVDDRLWVDSRATRCSDFLAVERGVAGDCGGRTPVQDAVDVYRALLVDGRTSSVPDGADRDDGAHDARRFPFLGPP